MSVLLPHPIDLSVHILHLAGRPFDSGAPISFALPALHVPTHFVVAPLLLVCVVAELTNVSLRLCLIHKLQSAGLSHSILFVALLSEVSPAPVAARPAGLFKVAHGWLSAVAK